MNSKDMQPKSTCDGDGRSEGGGERGRDGVHTGNVNVGEEIHVEVNV